MSDIDAVDLFAGPGGWDLALRELGKRGVGIENDEAACSTREAAGLETVKGDVRMFGPDMFPTAWLLIGSPPCQTYSNAGSGAGRKALYDVTRLARAMAAREPVDTSGLDESTALVLEPLRWALEAIDAHHPFEMIALEQVVGVLPVWEVIARALREEGYAVVTGFVQAEQYGVPQTRKRAILLARRTGGVSFPRPTHSKYYPHQPERMDRGLLPWVSMADALGWGMRQRPAFTVPAGGRRGSSAGAEWGSSQVRTHMKELVGNAELWLCATNRRASATLRSEDQPAPTMAFGKDSPRWIIHPDDAALTEEIKLTPAEAGVLQTFPDDYPFEGTAAKAFQQVGNAIPPLLARTLLEHLMLREVQEAPPTPVDTPQLPTGGINAHLHELGELADRRREVEESIVQRVAAARKVGASWSAIGEQLGVSKQAALKRYGA